MYNSRVFRGWQSKMYISYSSQKVSCEVIKKYLWSYEFFFRYYSYLIPSHEQGLSLILPSLLYNTRLHGKQFRLPSRSSRPLETQTPWFQSLDQTLIDCWSLQILGALYWNHLFRSEIQFSFKDPSSTQQNVPIESWARQRRSKEDKKDKNERRNWGVYL